MYRLYCDTITSCADHPGTGQVLCGVQGEPGGGHPPHPCPGGAGGQYLAVVSSNYDIWQYSHLSILTFLPPPSHLPLNPSRRITIICTTLYYSILPYYLVCRCDSNSSRRVCSSDSIVQYSIHSTKYSHSTLSPISAMAGPCIAWLIASHLRYAELSSFFTDHVWVFCPGLASPSASLFLNTWIFLFQNFVTGMFETRWLIELKFDQ